MSQPSVTPARTRIKSALSEILSRVRISHVYQALTGTVPRRTGQDTFRAPATWRKGDGFNVSLDNGRGVWHDFTTADGGGVLELVVRVHGGSRADALHWLADLTGQPLDRPLAAERARWAAERRAIEKDLLAAELWRRAAIALAEETLANLKAGLFDPAKPQPCIGEVGNLTRRLARWERLDGAGLVEEYRAWAAQHPKITAAMVQAARLQERAGIRAILQYFAETTV